MVWGITTVMAYVNNVDVWSWKGLIDCVMYAELVCTWNSDTNSNHTFQTINWPTDLFLWSLMTGDQQHWPFCSWQHPWKIYAIKTVAYDYTKNKRYQGALKPMQKIKQASKSYRSHTKYQMQTEMSFRGGGIRPPQWVSQLAVQKPRWSKDPECRFSVLNILDLHTLWQAYACHVFVSN